jgi:hypothetical protein
MISLLIADIFAGMLPLLISLLAAELFTTLVRTREIRAICKNEIHRTNKEKREIENGLARSVLLDFACFVPVSVILTFVIVTPFLMGISAVSIFVAKSSRHSMAFYGLLGIVSYGFPFAALRRWVTLVALNTLTNFAKVLDESQRPDALLGPLGQPANAARPLAISRNEPPNGALSEPTDTSRRSSKPSAWGKD